MLSGLRRLGVPHPGGFVVLPGEEETGLAEQVRSRVERMAAETGRSFGDPVRPLLLAVHREQGGGVSVLNLGLDDRLLREISGWSPGGGSRGALDSYRRFLETFGGAAYGIEGRAFRETAERVLGRRVSGPGLGEGELRELAGAFRDLISRRAGGPMPEDPYEQLMSLVRPGPTAGSAPRAVTVSRMISPLGDGLVGVAHTRDPRTGEKEVGGEFVDRRSGVSGSKSLRELEGPLPEVYGRLLRAVERLEQDHRRPVEVEFAVEEDELYVTKCRASLPAGVSAEIKLSVDLAGAEILPREQALLRVRADDLPELLHPHLDREALAGSEHEELARGVAASPGAASGRIALDAGKVQECREAGEEVVLVSAGFEPEEKAGLLDATAVVALPGALTSHDLVLLRSKGTPVVSECGELEILPDGVRLGDREVGVGEVVTVDGSGGAILSGSAPILGAETGGDLEELLRWADETRSLGVRANADTPEDARRSRELGAEGIGLCRTERMFMKGGRIASVRRMILAGSGEEEASILSELEPGQREDFEGLFRAMDGLPVAVRLLDPPLHEFLPGAKGLYRDLAEAGDEEEREMLRQTLRDVEGYEESDPMLGTRGVRLGLLRPRIYRMQSRAIAGALRTVRAEGYDPRVEILVPLVQFPEELVRTRRLVEEECAGLGVPIGPTIEAPRACAAAGSLAREAGFFSFGTNDLTQTTCATSRDDAKSGFLPLYLQEGILDTDPFETLDREGVGRMIELARDLGRAANPDLKLGVCGEHGGDPESMEFFEAAGLDYVSCSSYRVPVARLAAAQAAIRRSGIRSPSRR